MNTRWVHIIYEKVANHILTIQRLRTILRTVSRILAFFGEEYEEVMVDLVVNQRIKVNANL